MDKEEAVRYWFEGAERDRKVAKDLIRLGHNHWSLFMWHLVIEKLLKGILVKEGKEAIKVHSLFSLAADVEQIEFPERYMGWFKEITTFNIEARYDSYKLAFYKKALNKKYTNLWDERCEELYQWLLKKF